MARPEIEYVDDMDMHMASGFHVMRFKREGDVTYMKLAKPLCPICGAHGTEGCHKWEEDEKKDKYGFHEGRVAVFKTKEKVPHFPTDPKIRVVKDRETFLLFKETSVKDCDMLNPDAFYDMDESCPCWRWSERGERVEPPEDYDEIFDGPFDPTKFVIDTLSK